MDEIKTAAQKLIRIDSMSIAVVGKPVADIQNIKAGG